MGYKTFSYSTQFSIINAAKVYWLGEDCSVISVCFGGFCFSTAQGSSSSKGDIQITQRTNQHHLVFSSRQMKTLFQGSSQGSSPHLEMLNSPKGDKQFWAEYNCNMMIIVRSTKFQKCTKALYVFHVLFGCRCVQNILNLPSYSFVYSNKRKGNGYRDFFPGIGLYCQQLQGHDAEFKKCVTLGNITIYSSSFLNKS